MTVTDVQRNAVTLRLVEGYGVDACVAWSREALGLSPAEAEATVAKAQESISLASQVDRRAELGLAIRRLQDLYKVAREAGEIRIALQAERERIRLLRLVDAPKHPPPVGSEREAGEDGDAVADLAAIAAHLRPLKLGPPDYPLSEVARLAALEIQRGRA